MDYIYFFKLTVGGITKGSIYALIALGYTMVYGIIQLINFAHGEIYMIGAFTALIVAGLLQFAPTGSPAFVLIIAQSPFLIFFISIISAILFSAGYGYTIEKLAYKPLRNAPRLSALISAIGVSLFLQQYVAVAQTPNFLPFPDMLPELSFLGNISWLNPAQFFIIVTTTVIMIGLTLLIKKTLIGKAMRATSQDRVMAQLSGININKVISFTFIVGSVLAAIGGVLVSAYTRQIKFYIGFLAGIKAFVAAVLGGIGSIPGAVLGSLVLGIAESYGAGYLQSDYEDVYAFIILIIILTFKPSGIMGKKSVEKV